MRSDVATSRAAFLASALLLALSGAAESQVQLGLPPIAPTSMPAPISATAPAGPVASKPRKATVTYAAGLLDVRANDSSLNSILREIAKRTGMTITGGVTDQRVFGNYGPAEPSTVLATLLDGTGTNVFLKESAENAPAELVLTPREGGVTPPSPTSSQFNDQDEEEPQPAAQPAPSYPARPGFSQLPPTATRQAPPTATQLAPPLPITGAGPGTPAGGSSSASRPQSGVLGSPNAVSPSASTLPVTNSVPVDAVGSPSTAQPVSGIVDSPSGPPAGTTTSGFTAAATANANSAVTPTNDADTSGSTLPGGSTASAGSGSAPDGVRTPEQIFQQLQQLRQAAQAQQGQSGTTATSPANTTPATSSTTTSTQPSSTPQ